MSFTTGEGPSRILTLGVSLFLAVFLSIFPSLSIYFFLYLSLLSLSVDFSLLREYVRRMSDYPPARGN